MAYCDNLNVAATSPELAGEIRDMVVASLQKDGFRTHEEMGPATVATILGVVVDGDGGFIVPTPRRVWRCVKVMRWLSSRPVVSPKEVQVVLGHVASLVLIQRGALSVPRSLYDFAALVGGRRKLWNSAGREARILADIIPLVRVDLRAVWSKTAIATDASPEGFGVCETSLPTQVVASVGCWKERWRYKRLEPEFWRPRVRALQLDRLELLPAAIDLCKPIQHEHVFVAEESFPEVPP